MFSNNDLIRKLESLGTEVDIASFTEWIFFTTEMYRRDSIRKRSVGEYFDSRIKNYFQRKDEHDVLKHIHKSLDGETDNPVIIAGFGRFGVVAGRFLIAHGFKATILDHNPDNIDVLRKFGFKVYYGDATRPDLLHAAGAARAKILILAIDDREKSLKIADYVRMNFPQLKILGRAVDMKHSHEYLKRGIMDFNRDTFDSSLELGTKALEYLGFNRYQATRAARTFKHHDAEVLHELFKHYEQDEKQYLNEARRFARELEELLQTEQTQSIHEHDTAWDVTNLREEAKEIYEAAQKGRSGREKEE